MKNWMGKLELELMHTPDTTFLKKLKNIVFAAFVYLCWGTLILALYKLFVPGFESIPFEWNSSTDYNIHRFVSMCVLAPFTEELLYRVIAIESSKLTNDFRLVFLAIIISSVIFGSHHIFGRWSIPVQGVAGLCFSYAYLKNGSCYFSAVATHFLVNFIIFII